MNHEKTELLVLGGNTLREVGFPKHTICEVSFKDFRSVFRL